MSAFLQVQALRKEYFELVAVDDVDLEIAAGEIYGMIGPNGAGKTTMLRMMATTLEPTSGRVLLEGRDVERHALWMRRAMGFMPDFFQLYGDLKVREVLEYFARAHDIPPPRRRARVEEVLEIVQLAHKAETYVKGLSRGMTQRLGLGRAILHQPRLLLLDEPASGLDPLARRTLFAALRSAHAAGATIVISSHILGELSELCTSVGIMHNGRFLETGRTAEVVRRIMPARRMSLVALGSVEAVGRLLMGRPGVTNVRALDGRIEFDFDGDNEAIADINTALVTAGIRVALLQERETNLHEVYFAIAEREGAAHVD